MYKLANAGRYFFLSRPRRFGKSSLRVENYFRRFVGRGSHGRNQRMVQGVAKLYKLSYPNLEVKYSLNDSILEFLVNQQPRERIIEMMVFS